MLPTTTQAIAHASQRIPGSQDRLQRIALARHAVLVERSPAVGAVAPWIERSWQRCLQLGLQPNQEAVFEALSPAHIRRTMDAHNALIRAARPALEQLGRAIANTGYFAILTNAAGVVIDVSGVIDRSDRRADLITRIGTDLSESRVGTTAIGSTLNERQSVWLHRGEHFFANTGVYSCAGAPVFGPDGQCIGMLDVTGIDAVERPELRHLVSQVAARIENALLLQQPHRLLLRLNWPGTNLGGDSDGLLCLDADGLICGSNAQARQMVAALERLTTGGPALQVSDVFGLPYTLLFDAARRRQVVDVPLWSGLYLQALALEASLEPVLEPHGLAYTNRLGTGANGTGTGLKDLETALIRRAVDEARGNVAAAAAALGISRATVYRKLGRRIS